MDFFFHRGESEKRCIVDEEIILSDICRPIGGRKVPQRLAIYVEKYVVVFPSFV